MDSRFSLHGPRHAREVVNEFLARNKTLVGTTEDWVPHPFDRESRLKWVIAADGIPTDASLDATAYPLADHYPFTITLNFPPCIWRLDFDPPYARHNNPFSEFLGFDLIVYGPHYHAWVDHARYAKPSLLPKELDWARSLPTSIRRYEHALRWFCDETNIRLENDQFLDLPPRGLL